MSTLPMTQTTCPGIPQELKARAQWVSWRWEESSGRRTKVPVNPHTGRHASTNNPNTWGTYQEAVASVQRFNLVGVGFVFNTTDDFVGIDLDDVYDEATGDIVPWAADIVRRLNSYTEVSPSGAGLKVFLRGTLPPGGRGWGEGHGMYDAGRFFTVTGQHLAGTPCTVETRQAEVTALHTETFPARLVSTRNNETEGRERLSDEEALQRARSAANGDKFAALWEGDWQEWGYPSQSEADAALCSLLAYWTGPHTMEQVDRLFRQSGLMRGKWDECVCQAKNQPA